MKFNLEERLINFAVLILEITEKLPETRGSSHLSGQLVRCGTAPALHYGEAQSVESRKDFIHDSLKGNERIIDLFEDYRAKEIFKRSIYCEFTLRIK